MDAINHKTGNRPEKGRGVKIIGMGGNIHQDMDQPAAHFPNWLLENEPNEAENEKEYDQAMA